MITVVKIYYQGNDNQSSIIDTYIMRFVVYLSRLPLISKKSVFPASLVKLVSLHMYLVLNYVNLHHLKKCLRFPTKNGEFTEKDRKKGNEVFHKLCLKKMNYQGNTTNVMVHLHYNHHLEHHE